MNLIGRIRNAFRVSSLLVLTTLLIPAVVVISACGDDDEPVAAEPTATATAEPASEFQPEQLLEILVVEDGPVTSAAFSPDGEMIAAGAYLEAHLLTAPGGESIRVIVFNHSVDDLEFSHDGSLIGAGQGLYGVQLNHVEDGAEAIVFHGGYDNRLAFAPNGESIATANRDGVVWIWDVETGEQLNEFVPPEDEYALSVEYSPDGTLVALGNWNGNVFLFNANDGSLVDTLDNPEEYGYASRVSFSPDGAQLAVAGSREEWKEVTRIWMVDDGSEHGVVRAESQTRAVSYSPDGSQLAIGDAEGISIVSAEDLSVLYRFEHEVDPGTSAWITDLVYSPDGTMLLASRWDGVIELWRVQEYADTSVSH